MQVKIVYSEGFENIIDIPDYMENCAEFKTSKPDTELINVTVKRDWANKSELPVYIEVDDE